MVANDFAWCESDDTGSFDSEFSDDNGISLFS